MWFIGVEVEQQTSEPPPKRNPGSAPDWKVYLGILVFGLTLIIRVTISSANKKLWFKNLLAETWHFNTQEYKNLKQVPICGLQVNLTVKGLNPAPNLS